MLLRWMLPLGLTLLWSGSLPAAAGEELPVDTKPTAKAYRKPEPVRFVRLRTNGAGKPVALQVANAVYRPVDGSRLEVTLYGAVHVGEEDYYAGLNRAFRGHEVLLFELANDPQVLRERDDAPSVFSLFQMDFGAQMGLADQLEEIDYDRPNFVHADIPFDDLMQHAENQGDDMLTMAAQTLLDVQRMMNRGDDPFQAMLEAQGDLSDPFGGMLTQQDPKQMKLQMARQLVQQAEDGILEGITVLNRYLISARNERCLEVLEQQIGKGKTDIAIFYGAGHNADFHRRLMADYGLKPVRFEWVDAWDLTKASPPRSKPKSADEMSDQELLMTLLKRMMEE